MGAVVATAGLVAVEPDFGTALFLVGAGSLTALAAGVRLRHILPFGILGLPPAIFLLYSKFGHIRDRLSVFLHPDLDPLGKGHQVRQSLIALGSGGAFGSGIGAGRMKLYFLPENFTDFILALIGEETGLAGTLLVLFCFGMLLFAGLAIARRARDLSGFVLAYGITVIICAQAFINIAVVTASVPTKGISLPFVSYGGSSLVCMMGAMGILLNVARLSVKSEAGDDA
jgi:cell division protein FtsW